MMKKAILCIGNRLRGDDGVALKVGEMIQSDIELKEWRVFVGEDVPEDEFGRIKEYMPDILVVIDAISSLDNRLGEIDFYDLSDDREYIYATHNLPTPMLISYLRNFVPRTIFLGISVSLENMLEFKETLSDEAQSATKKAIKKIKFLDKNL